MAAKAKAQRFTAMLERSEDGRGALLRVPFDVKALFGKARAPVKVTLRGVTFPTTVAVYGGESLIGVRRELREAAGVTFGDSVDVTVTADEDERVVQAPADLLSALKGTKGALAAWESFSYTHQREHVEAIVSAKKPQTRARRIEKAVEMLLAKAKDKARGEPRRKSR